MCDSPMLRIFPIHPFMPWNVPDVHTGTLVFLYIIHVSVPLASAIYAPIQCLTTGIIMPSGLTSAKVTQALLVRCPF